MVRISVKELTDVVSGKLYGDVSSNGQVVEGVSIDTRKLTGTEVFVALKGEKTDGHSYVTPNIKARVVIAERPVDFPCCIIVEDTYKALGDIARFHRVLYQPLVFAVTGSNGKTTTKEMLRAILEEDGKVLATEGNYNNEIGLPLTVFRLDETYQYAVLEMGMRGIGQVDYLAKIAKPSVGIVTNIGEVHLELLGTRANIAKAKGELLENLPENGLGVIPKESDFYQYLKSLCPRTIAFGRGGDVEAEDVVFDEENRATFTLKVLGQSERIALALPGSHNVENALAAAGAAAYAGIELGKIKRALENLTQVSGRLEEVRVLNLIVIDDTYNASPLSMKAALEHLRRRSDALGLKAYAALGDMKELGSEAAEYHRTIGALCAELNLDGLYLYGSLMEQYALSEARRLGLSAEAFSTHAEIAENLKDLTGIVLLKGSRSMEMERVLAYLKEFAAEKNS